MCRFSRFGIPQYQYLYGGAGATSHLYKSIQAVGDRKDKIAFKGSLNDDIPEKNFPCLDADNVLERDNYNLRR
jgi:hypothetical protein